MPRSAALGYAMVAVAAALYGVNASVVKVIEHTGFDAQRLTEVRSTGAFVGLLVIVLATRPGAVSITPRELGLVAALGVGGLALVQWSYFFAIHRLPIGEALLIQFVAPLLVALWARFAFHERVRRRLWAALVLSLVGLVLIVELWRGRLDGAGIAVAWMIVLGSIVPFTLVVAALPRIGATRTAIVAMLEPVFAIFVAWVWLGESLDAVQLVGAALTLAGIALAQTTR